MLEAQHISWCQTRGALIAGVSVTLAPGEWISLMGPNGAGKSTLLQLLAGALDYPAQSFTGGILWQGEDWTQVDPRVRASRIAYLGSELDSAFPMTVLDAVSSGSFTAIKGSERPLSSDIEFAIQFCELQHLRARDLRSLSGGERQRVLLARGLVQGARMLFLDETFGKMDLDYQFELGSKLHQLTAQGFSVVLVSHDPAMVARFADRVWLLSGGKLLMDGTPNEVFRDEVLSRVFPRANLASLFQGSS